MKLLAIPITKIKSIKLPDFSHLHRGSLIAASIAVASAVLFIVIPDTQTAAHGFRSGREVETLVRGVQSLHHGDASFASVSDSDLVKIDPAIQSNEGAGLQDGWLTHLAVKPATLQQPDDAFVLSFVDADSYACPRVVKAMAGQAARISVAKTEVSGPGAASTDATQLQALCTGPDATIELTFARD